MSVKIILNFQEGSNHFSLEEAKEYGKYFESIGKVEVSTFRAIEAGGSAVLDITLELFRDAILGGVIWDIVKGLGMKIKRIYKERKKIGKYGPEIKSITLKSPDLHVNLSYSDRENYSPDEFSIHLSVFDSICEIYKVILVHVGELPLQGVKFNVLVVPVLAAHEEDQKLIKQFWKIQSFEHDIYGFGTYYDFINRKILEIRPSLLKNGEE